MSMAHIWDEVCGQVIYIILSLVISIGSWLRCVILLVGGCMVSEMIDVFIGLYVSRDGRLLGCFSFK